MTNKEKQAREILNKYNQNHIVEWMDKVDRKTKDLIVDQVFDIDFEELERLYDNVNKVKEKKNYNITPIEVTNKELIDAKQKEEYYNLGEKVLENNELAIITLAGGQGTRLGHNGPKGSFKIDIGEKGKYLFEMIIDQLIDANKKYGVTIPYYIMTSVENNDETIAFFEDNNYFNYPKEYIKFFKQAEEPLVDKFGKLLINEDKVIKLASNGNGEIYKSLAKNKILDDMNSKNFKWIVVIRVFDERTKKKVYAKQTAKAETKHVSNCPYCAMSDGANRTRIYKLSEMDADHVTAWSHGGSTDEDNCQMLCKTHNRAKGNR